jgi:hypothetical protein
MKPTTTTTRRYRVHVDICYLDGALSGLTIADGFDVDEPTRSDAFRVYRWLERVKLDDDFIRATGTGHRYKLVGCVHVDEVSA